MYFDIKFFIENRLKTWWTLQKHYVSHEDHFITFYNIEIYQYTINQGRVYVFFLQGVYFMEKSGIIREVNTIWRKKVPKSVDLLAETLRAFKIFHRTGKAGKSRVETEKYP